MKYLLEYRDKVLAQKLISEIKAKSKKPLKLMEVCGGHTMAIRKYGIQQLLPPNIKLLSGPGCPVCVTDKSYLDKAIAIGRLPDVTLTSFGDLVRVPGSSSSFEKESASGADIRIVGSSLEALELAIQNPQKKVIFLAIGFETTTPATAVSIIKAAELKLKNFFVFSAHKIMPPAMEALLIDGTQIDGYIGPGHVSTIAGSKIYDQLLKKFGISVVISGFEPLDILQTILMLVIQHENGKPAIEIQYSRAVSYKGNQKAQRLVEQVFEYADCGWRGIGNIPLSGLRIKQSFKELDAENHFDIITDTRPEPKACICGKILCGKNTPADCKLFSRVCNPENPVGACMVSGEGTCAAWYKYGGSE